MRVLITRPAADSEPLAEALRGRGIEPVIEPLLAIGPAGETPDLDGVQAVLLTSANGARALAQKTARRDLQVFAVGDATARAARELGFDSVESAAGDVAALAALVADELDPDDGALLHVAGSAVAGDLAGTLEVRGFEIRRAVLYEARVASAISEPTCKLLVEGDIGAVLFFSPRTAQTFVILANQARLGSACGDIAAICLSPAVAKAAEGLNWREVRLAERPETGALLAALDGWMKQLKAGD